MTPLRVVDVLTATVADGDRSFWTGSLVAQCSRSMDAAGVGLAVADGTGLVGVAAATAGLGRAGEDLQFALEEGPCQLASRTRRTVHAPALADDDRWVQFAREATLVGIAAAFSAPLQVGAVLVGVLDVYRAAAGPLSAESARVMSVYAEAATAVLLLLTDTDGGGGDATEIADLADLRPVVHQAAGMVAIQLDVDLTAALLRLRAHAFGSGRPLRELAADVVARRVRFDDAPDVAAPPRGPSPVDPRHDPDVELRYPDERT